MNKIPLSEVNWGPTDANEEDADFLSKFVEPEFIKQLFGPKYSFISGEKGSGKSAFCQALRKKYYSDFVAVADISFDKQEFTKIVRELTQLAQVTDLETLTLLTNYWRYCLLIEAMRALVGSGPDHIQGELKKIRYFLSRRANGASNILETMLKTISHAWTFFVDEPTSPSASSRPRRSLLPSSLTAEVISSILNYPNRQESFLKIQNEFSNAISKCGSKLLIILDGFDTIKNTQAIRESVNLIFESLVSAVYGLAIEKPFSDKIQIKALIPNDRYLSLNLRDMDKLDAKHKSIRWDYGGLKNFLAKRIARHPKLGHTGKFDSLWTAILPDRIVNPFYQLEESSYDYILRHTMYRPRQLQIHLEKLASKYAGEVIQPAMIPKSIRESNIKLARFFFLEYALDHPHLEEFLLSRFKRKENVMPYKGFRDIIHKALRQYGVQQVTADQKIEVLYSIGFFGIIDDVPAGQEQMHSGDRYLPPRKSTTPAYKVDFYYTTRRQNITRSLSDDSQIALHPIFVDFAEMNPHPSMIIG